MSYLDVDHFGGRRSPLDTQPPTHSPPLPTAVEEMTTISLSLSFPHLYTTYKSSTQQRPTVRDSQPSIHKPPPTNR